ncbi:MAG TPA: sialidase family protein, partial [Lacipirellulaceae bacterium]|nr:sialidase family protein [Lacipirellulaceae bacterium]
MRVGPTFAIDTRHHGSDSPADAAIISSEYIFTSAPFKQCHASTIAETPKGLVAAWFGGTREKNPDVCIWVSRQVSDRWTAPVEVANGVQSPTLRYPTWNPVLFQPKGGPLLLFYKVGPSPPKWWGMLMKSADCGTTWSSPQKLPSGNIGPVKNKPVQLPDGTLVCPSSTEDHGWRLHLETSPDLGLTWSRSPPLNDGIKKGAIQPSILFHSDGSWQIVARDRRRKGFIWTASSVDGGKTWSQLKSTQLPNPSSGIDAVTLADGRQLLVYNHSRRLREDSDIGQSRSVLNVAVSSDGKHWQAALVLEDSPGEYSYPAV